MADTRSLAAIDKQIQFLWTCYRKWYDLGTETGISPIDALTEIDVLLEHRHDLARSQGEMRHTDDIATAQEWGGASL
jgi:hypothetical protein